MSPDTALGVSAELRFLLKEGWTFTQEVERFKIKPPADIHATKNFKDVLSAEVWRVAQFVAYANFVSIARLPNGGYVVASHMPSSEGFEIEFLPS